MYVQDGAGRRREGTLPKIYPPASSIDSTATEKLIGIFAEANCRGRGGGKLRPGRVQTINGAIVPAPVCVIVDDTPRRESEGGRGPSPGVRGPGSPH